MSLSFLEASIVIDSPILHMRKLRLGEVNTNDLGDERCSQMQTRVCGTPSLFDCILLPPWIVASWWGVERVSTIYSKTGSLISVFYGQAFGRSLGTRKSRRLPIAGGSIFTPVVCLHKNRVRNQQNPRFCQILGCCFGLGVEELSCVGPLIQAAWLTIY